jgi:hypothetical protein
MDLMKLMVMQMVADALWPETAEQLIADTEKVLAWLGKDEPVVDDDTDEDSDNVIHLVVTPDETGTEH